MLITISRIKVFEIFIHLSRDDELNQVRNIGKTIKLPLKDMTEPPDFFSSLLNNIYCKTNFLKVFHKYIKIQYMHQDINTKWSSFI